MRVGFAGTPAFAATILEAILEAGFAVPLVLTQPDRPKGRGLRSEASAVKRIATQHHIPVFEPATLRSPANLEALLAVPLDVLAVAAYGLILPAAVLAWPRHGAINVHASLLPRWRGAAPVQRAILAGDTETGVTIMRVDEGLDTGPILDAVEVALGLRETAASLTARLAREGSAALIRVLRDLGAGIACKARPQGDAGATYAAKIDKREAAIDWGSDAIAIDRAIRAFDPVPGAMSWLDGEAIKLWRAEPLVGSNAGEPGTIVEAAPKGFVVACGDGALRVLELQPAGRGRMDAAAFVAGRRNLRGARFGAPSA